MAGGTANTAILVHTIHTNLVINMPKTHQNSLKSNVLSQLLMTHTFKSSWFPWKHAMQLLINSSEGSSWFRRIRWRIISDLLTDWLLKTHVRLCWWKGKICSIQWEHLFDKNTALRWLFAIFEGEAAQGKMVPDKNTAGLPCRALLHHIQMKWEQTAKKTHAPRRECGIRKQNPAVNYKPVLSFAVFPGAQLTQGACFPLKDEWDDWDCLREVWHIAVGLVGQIRKLQLQHIHILNLLASTTFRIPWISDAHKRCGEKAHQCWITGLMNAICCPGKQLSLFHLSHQRAPKAPSSCYRMPARGLWFHSVPGKRRSSRRSCGWSLYYLPHVQTAAGENYTLLQIPGRLAGEQWNTGFCTLPVLYSKQTQMVRMKDGAASVCEAQLMTIIVAPGLEAPQ